uniref:Transcription factor JunD n=1 Tax=Cairina moschata TaxID=8855 RepID=A0A8C3GGI3_CAIMO
MGHPTAALLLLLLLPAAASASCFSSAPATQEDFSNSSTGCSELDWSIFGQQRRLLLAHNGIGAVRPASRVEPTLEELDLSHNALRHLPGAFLQRAQSLRRLLLGHNRLRELPDGFFAAAAALQSLELQDNPLPAVPSSAFHPSLSLLTVPCRCDVVGSYPAVSYAAEPGPFAAPPPRLPPPPPLKDEPQIVPEVPSFGESPPLSPIDMDTQERIKAERKRLRNRIAASKCRKRKLERISRLEEKVKSLKSQNTELASTASLLREQVAQLKQKVLSHVNSGCQLLPQHQHQVPAY